MRKYILIVLFCSLIFNINAQEKKKGLKIYNASLSWGVYLPVRDRESGFAVNLDVGFKSLNNIFKLYIGIGKEFSLTFGKKEPITDNFEEYSILYGRELKMSKRFHIDLFAGIGFLLISNIIIVI